MAVKWERRRGRKEKRVQNTAPWFTSGGTRAGLFRFLWSWVVSTIRSERVQPLGKNMIKWQLERSFDVGRDIYEVLVSSAGNNAARALRKENDERSPLKV